MAVLAPLPLPEHERGRQAASLAAAAVGSAHGATAAQARACVVPTIGVRALGSRGRSAMPLAVGQLGQKRTFGRHC